MSDLALLLGAIATVITALGAATAGVITALRNSPRERKQAARDVLTRLAEAAKDGSITQEEFIAALESKDEEDDE